VVSTDAGGIPYLIEDGRNGLLVPVGDADALARAALRVLRDEGLAAHLSQQGREDCLRRFTWPAVANDWIGTYTGLALPGPARSG
jgi:glycosyltransferase involved in cell wall biosynthesis